MNALLLAAGYGKRLGKYTKKTPKCLLPVYGEVLLIRWINLLNRLNIKKIFINTHYKSKQVKDLLKKKKLNQNIFIKHEKKLLGTAGTIYKLEKYFDSHDVLIIHADNYIEDNLVKFMEFHKVNKKKGLIASIFAYKSKNFRKEGILKIDKNKIFKEIFEKKNIKLGNIANGAIYIISKKGLKLFKNNYEGKKDFTKNYLSLFIKKAAVYLTKNSFDDIGAKATYRKYV